MGNVLVTAVDALRVPHLQQNSAWTLFSFLKQGVFTHGRQSRWWEESGEGLGRVKRDEQEGRGLRLLFGCLQRRGCPQGPAAPQVA